MPHTTALTKKLEELKKLAEASGIDVSDELTLLESKVKAASKTEMAWRRVELARHPDRPYALDYITRIFDNFIELHGDRYFGDDAAIVGGLAFLNGQPVTIIANQKGRSLKENMKRNHGMANPEGYRKALRLAKQAEKFHRPIITFVDTSGAYPGCCQEGCTADPAPFLMNARDVLPLLWIWLRPGLVQVSPSFQWPIFRIFWFRYRTRTAGGRSQRSCRSRTRTFFIAWAVASGSVWAPPSGS